MPNLTFQAFQDLNVTVYDNFYNVLGYISNNESNSNGSIFLIKYSSDIQPYDALLTFLNNIDIISLLLISTIFVSIIVYSMYRLSKLFK